MTLVVRKASTKVAGFGARLTWCWAQKRREGKHENKALFEIYFLRMYEFSYFGCAPSSDIQRELETYKYVAQMQELTEAARIGDTRKAKVLIDRGASLSSPYPLQAAVLNNQYEMVDYLINQGSPINGDGSTQSPLWFSVTHGDMKMAELPVKLGADVDFQTDSMGTPLFSVTYTNNYDGKINRLQLSQFLVENGANLGITDQKGKTPKQCAQERLHEIKSEELKPRIHVIISLLEQAEKNQPNK